jgi:hypothetical protein
MALLPARRGGTFTRPGSQAEARWHPFSEFADLYQWMGNRIRGHVAAAAAVLGPDG